MTYKYILYGGAVIMSAFMLWLLWLFPLYAACMFLGTISGGIYLELLSGWEKSKKAKTTPENEWTGV